MLVVREARVLQWGKPGGGGVGWAACTSVKAWGGGFKENAPLVNAHDVGMGGWVGGRVEGWVWGGLVNLASLAAHLRPIELKHTRPPHVRVRPTKPGRAEYLLPTALIHTDTGVVDERPGHVLGAPYSNLGAATLLHPGDEEVVGVGVAGPPVGQAVNERAVDLER